MTWTAPAALWLLVSLPLVWAVVRFSRTNFNVRQRWLQAAVRSLLLAALALSLARPVISIGSSRISLVYLVDVSHSISSRAIADAASPAVSVTVRATRMMVMIVSWSLNH